MASLTYDLHDLITQYQPHNHFHTLRLYVNQDSIDINTIQPIAIESTAPNNGQPVPLHDMQNSAYIGTSFQNTEFVTVNIML